MSELTQRTCHEHQKLVQPKFGQFHSSRPNSSFHDEGTFFFSLLDMNLALNSAKWRRGFFASLLKAAKMRLEKSSPGLHG